MRDAVLILTEEKTPRFFLHSPDDAAWVADVNDEALPAVLFDSPEDVYVARLRSCHSANERMQRREAALTRLGMVHTSGVHYHLKVYYHFYHFSARLPLKTA